jgi:hypothetical protein
MIPSRSPTPLPKSLTLSLHIFSTSPSPLHIFLLPSLKNISSPSLPEKKMEDQSMDLDGQGPRGILAKLVDICMSGFSRQNDFIGPDCSDSVRRLVGPLSTSLKAWYQEHEKKCKK